jgi:hypothetical protein
MCDGKQRSYSTGKTDEEQGMSRRVSESGLAYGKGKGDGRVKATISDGVGREEGSVRITNGSYS